MNRNECKELIKEFIEQRLNGDIQTLKNYDLLQLQGDEKFGCSKGEYFDCDITNIMKAIYVVLWGEEFPQLTYENIGPGKLYRGDTMNSFGTVFGKPLGFHHQSFVAAEKFGFSEETKKMVRMFYRTYHTLGNMIVLPDLSVDHQSINRYRGVGGWHDFFDIFLMELEKCLQGKGDGDKVLEALIEKNKFAFSKFDGEPGFQHFCKITWLENYLNPDGTAKSVFAPHLYHWCEKMESCEYEAFAQDYIDEAMKIIKCRGEKMIAKLDAILREKM